MDNPRTEKVAVVNEVRERMEQELGREVLAFSAVTGEGLSRLVRAVVERLAEAPLVSPLPPSWVEGVCVDTYGQETMPQRWLVAPALRVGWKAGSVIRPSRCFVTLGSFVQEARSEPPQDWWTPR